MRINDRGPFVANRIIDLSVAAAKAAGLPTVNYGIFFNTVIDFLIVGFAIFLFELYRTQSTNDLLLTILAYASLQFLPRVLRMLIFSGLGIGLVGYGILRLNRSLLRPFIRPGRAVVDELADYQLRRRGPRIAAIGGGHGLSTLLRGLKVYTRKLTAIVTVADDGGSSGRLRRDLRGPLHVVRDIRNVPSAVARLAEPGDVVMTLGAGTIGAASEAILAELKAGTS